MKRVKSLGRTRCKRLRERFEEGLKKVWRSGGEGVQGRAIGGERERDLEREVL